jgi:hypothetical protein
MPFTFSHPAIVLPLAYLQRRWFSLTGLVIGSLTPDFEYFLRMRSESHYSHTIGGLFLFDLPLGLLLAFIFHNIVRNSLFDNLPFFLKSRFSTVRRFDWNGYFKKRWPAVIVSIIIGAISHLLWDGFTHKYGFFVGIMPALANEINFLSIQTHIYQMLQYVCTLIGGFVIVFAIYKLPIACQKTESVNIKYWMIVIGITLGVVGIRFLSGLDLRQYGHVIVTIISAGLISLTLTPLLIKAKRR